MGAGREAATMKKAYKKAVRTKNVREQKRIRAAGVRRAEMNAANRRASTSARTADNLATIGGAEKAIRGRAKTAAKKKAAARRGR